MTCYKQWRNLFFITAVFCTTWFEKVYTFKIADVKHGNGTFLLNAIFPITNQNGEINPQSGIMYFEAMMWAIEQVNKAPNYLHGYQLGVKEIYDSLREEEVQKNVLDTFMDKVPFLIGPYSSETSYISSILTKTFKDINTVSYSATYSDFDSYRQKEQQPKIKSKTSTTDNLEEERMLRTVPSDRFRVKAAVKLVQDLHWSFISVVSSYGYNGERDSLHFTSLISSTGGCLAAQVDLPKVAIAEDFKKAVEHLRSDSRLRVLVLFTTSEDTRQLIEMLKQMHLTRRFHLICVYGCTNYINVIEGNEEVADGTLSLDLKMPDTTPFKEYFLAKRPTANSRGFFKKYWEKLFDCSLSQTNLRTYTRMCTMNERMDEGHGYYKDTLVHTVMDAVFHIARAVRGFLTIYCHVDRSWNNHTDPCPLDPKKSKEYSKYFHSVLVKNSYNDGTLYPSDLKPLLMQEQSADRNVRYDVHLFTFNNRRKRNSKVWQWHIDRKEESKSNGISEFLNTTWYTSTNSSKLRSAGSCSDECPLGFVRDHDRNSIKSECCWSCVKCPRNNWIINNTCLPCQKTEVVDHNYQTCVLMEEARIDWNDPIVLCFIVLSVLGICLTVFVALVFCWFNDNRIVRASGRDLTYIILLGICVTFSCSFVFIWQTTQATCILRGGLPGFCFLTCYAPLFLKTIRIYRIFMGAQVSVSRPAMVNMQSQFIALFVILSIQLLISVVWFVSKIPMPEIIVTGDYIVRHCSGDTSPILLFLNLLLSVIFMVSCTVLAFKTREFPKNFNEAKFIGITLYITCVGWAVFLPVYFLSPHIERDFMKELLMCGVCTFIGYVTLFGLFGYKIKLLLYGPLPPARDSTVPTWYIPREHSKSMCSTYSCECRMHSPKSNSNDSNETYGFASL